jgi:hypothetical protein
MKTFSLILHSEKGIGIRDVICVNLFDITVQAFVLMKKHVSVNGLSDDDVTLDRELVQ